MAPSTSIIAKPVSQLAAFASRLFQAPSDNIRGIDSDAWYSPLQPVKPMGPADESPKGFQFYAGQNLIWTPRPDAEYSAWELKDLATYPLARICIENVKDSISRIPWQVQYKRQPGETKKQLMERSKGSKDLLKIQKFFDQPDRENCWDDWLRPLVEDMLVIDAASILVRKTFSGEVAELRVLPGEMFTRYIDKNGYTPLPPDPAYAQIWWGVPLLNLTTEQLVYKPRNIVRRGTISSNLYGMSPTEQLALEIIPGRKRLEFVTSYYTAGSIPDVVQVVPPGVPPDKIAEAMQWMNSDLAGNLAARRQWRMVQGFQPEGKADQILFPKEPLLADTYDELHIRKICFGYGTSPQRLMRMMGTRNAGEQQEAAELEGLIPWLDWVKNVRDHITQRVFGFQDIESTYDSSREPDPEKQANSLKTMVSSCVLTPNEAREKLGEEPSDADEADMLGTITANGFVPLSAEDQIAQQQTLGTDPESQHKRNVEVAASKPAPVVAKPNDEGEPASAVGKPNGHAKPNGKDKTAHAMGFAAVLDTPPPQPIVGTGAYSFTKNRAHNLVRPKIDPRSLTPQSQLALRKFQVALHNAFVKMEAKTVKLLAKRLVKSRAKAKKDEDAILRQILDQVATDWDLLPDEIEELYAQAGLGGAALGALQVSLTDEDALSTVNETAARWANLRAAELVGMRRLENGQLIQNPDARWAITDSTRDALRTVVRDLFLAESPTLKDVEQRIQESGIYSDKRASMIARTEISAAQTNGNLAAWQQSGKVASVDFQLSGNHDHDDECDDAASGGPYALGDAPVPPLHPNCDCVLVLNELTSEGEL